MSLVSVIIPFFNRIELVKESIQSVIDQTYRPIEVVLVDDCSNEHLDTRQFEDSGISITHLRNEFNLGPASSRFYGLSKSAGQFVCFLDSDDIIQPVFVEKLVAKLKDHPELTFAYCFTRNFNERGVLGDRGIEQEVVAEILPWILLSGRVWSTSSCLWNGSILRRISPFEGRIWEDYRMDVAAGLLNNKIGCVPEYLCYYRMGDYPKAGVIISEQKRICKLDSIIAIHLDIAASGISFPDRKKVEDVLISAYLANLIQLETKVDFIRYFERIFLPPGLGYNLLLNAAQILPCEIKRVFVRLLKREYKYRVSIVRKIHRSHRDQVTA